MLFKKQNNFNKVIMQSLRNKFDQTANENNKLFLHGLHMLYYTYTDYNAA